jgi:hypothetical protein
MNRAMDTETDQEETSMSSDGYSTVGIAMSPELHNEMVNQPGFREAVRSLIPDGALHEASAEPTVISSNEEERLRENRRIPRAPSRENNSNPDAFARAVNSAADGRRKSRSKSSKSSTSCTSCTSLKSCSVDMASEQFARLNREVWAFFGAI